MWHLDLNEVPLETNIERRAFGGHIGVEEHGDCPGTVSNAEFFENECNLRHRTNQHTYSCSRIRSLQ